MKTRAFSEFSLLAGSLQYMRFTFDLMYISWIAIKHEIPGACVTNVGLVISVAVWEFYCTICKGSY